MAIGEAEGPLVVLRMLIYAGTVLVAGGVLFRLTFPCLARAASILRWQIAAGAALLILCEPARYLLFLLQVSGGDLALALSPSMRWIGLETPLGQASLVRLAALAVIFFLAPLKWRGLALAAALAMIGSYLLQGHTVSEDERAILAPLLLVHLVAMHWWIGALPPLFAAASIAPTTILAQEVKRFGQYAAWVVGALALAGAILLGELTRWNVDPGSAYQQAFAIKLGAVVAILFIAAVNKFRVTPQLAQDQAGGRVSFRRWLGFEMAVGALILFATALATSFAPTTH